MSSTGTRPNRWGQPMQYALTELEAFDAMSAFLGAFWRRGDCKSDDIANLLSFISRTPWPSGRQLPHLVGAPLDIAQWEDWLDAVASVKANRERPS